MLPNYYTATIAETLLTGTAVSTVYVSNIQTPDGQTISITDFAQEGGTGYIIVDAQNSALCEYISFTGIDAVNIAFTGTTRGLSFKGTNSITANMTFHSVGAPVIIGWSGQDTLNFFDLYTAQSVSGQKTFTVSPIVPTPTSGQTTYATNVAYVNSVAIAGAPYASNTQTGITRLSFAPSLTLGTTTVSIASPAVVTFSNHGLTAGDVIEFTTTGALPTGITASTPYYVIATGLTTNTFEISTTLGGTAINTTGTQSGIQTLIKVTPIAFSTSDPIFTQTYSGNALNGSTNKILDSKSIGTAANDVVALDGSGRLPAVDGSQLINLPQSTLTPNAGNELFAGDSVYYSAANTVKRVQPNGYGTYTAGSNAYSTSSTGMQLYYVDGAHILAIYNNASTNQFTPGTLFGAYYALSGEVDFTATIAGGSLGIATVAYFELSQINSGNTFLLGYQNGSANIVVLTIGASSFTVGTSVQIDSGGGTYITVDMITATTGIVGWNRSSDNATCLNIFTISGTTITLGATYVATLPGTATVIRQIKILSSTLAALTYTSTVSTTVTHNVIPVNFSGTTVVSVGTNQSLTTASSGNITTAGSAVRKLTSGRIVVLTSPGSGATYGTGAISLTTCSITSGGIGSTSNIASLDGSLEYCTNSFGNYVPFIVNSSTGFSVMFATANGSTVTENLLTYEVDSLSLAMSLFQSVQTPVSTSSATQYPFIRMAFVKTGKYAYFNFNIAQQFKLLALSLTATTTRVGVAAANATEGTQLSVVQRNQATSGIYSGLTFNTTYYIGDNGQPNIQQSTINQVTPTLGIAISTTQILLQ